jgi:hypothetical protein
MMSLTNRSSPPRPTEQTTYTTGPQPVPNPASRQWAGAAKFGLGVGVASLLGAHRYKTGKLGWDYLLQGVRAAEEYSPGRVLRTFQFSHLLSPLGSASKAYRYWSPEILLKMATPGGEAGATGWIDYTSSLFGKDITRPTVIEKGGKVSVLPSIMEQGFRYENGQILLGKTGKQVLLKHAGIIRAPTGAGTRLQEAYARSLIDGPLPGAQRIFAHRVSYLDKAASLHQEVHMIIGGQSKRQAAQRHLFGYGTSLVERINQLARSPAELPIISDIVKHVPFMGELGVKSSSGLKTLGKITGKLGILGGAAYIGYQQLDWMTRDSKLTRGTVFQEGISVGIGTLATRLYRGYSAVAEKLGLHKYRQRQEEIAPGSTSLLKLSAFPLMGALGGVGAGYAQRILRMTHYQSLGLDIGQTTLAEQAETAFFKEAVYGTTVSKDILSGIQGSTLKLAREHATMQAGGFSGRIAQRLSLLQGQRGVKGSLARLFGDATPSRLKWIGGALAGAALIAHFGPGALIPDKTPAELDDLYSGKAKVPIRKGRFWEMGRSPYEGGRIDRFQQHWLPRMRARATEKGIWGDNVPSPIKRWFLENFTYEVERRHYKDRPYPISGAAFEGIPFIGPTLATTVGRLVKPPVLLHQEEWTRQGPKGLEYAQMPLKYEERPLPGERGKGAPISPYGVKGTVGEQIYRMTEMVGLPGFTFTAIKEAITGQQDTLDQEAQLESASKIYGMERDYWDREIGGGAGMTELYRRLVPHQRRQIERYNPIRNTMPDWLSGSGERAPDFLHGDPYSKIPLGEERLPGPGYAALHPELKGLAPKDYPALHRFSILADVAPYSDRYKAALIDVRAAKARKQLSEEEIEQVKEIQAQVAAKKVRKQFTDYKYTPRVDTPMERILAGVNEQTKSGTSRPSWFEQTIGSYWEQLTHKSETPLEFLTPISPASKLVHARTAVEDYERTQFRGTDNAFWQHPIRDFLKPFGENVMGSLGSKDTPKDVAERREIEDYFDTLKYIKYTRLKRGAIEAEDDVSSREFESKRRETLFGINPFTWNFSHIMRALPRRERDYFNKFTEADMAERSKIMEMIPENEKKLMESRWKLKDIDDTKKAIKKGLLSDEQVQKSETVLSQLYEEQKNEGMPKNQELWVEYQTSRLQGESYPDWYRRTKLLEKKLAGKGLPGRDWVGFHPAVDLEDIKLKIVQDDGKSMFDYDLWPDRMRAVARRPVVTQAAEELQESSKEDPQTLRGRINDILSAHGITANHVSLVAAASGEPTINLDVQEDRTKANKKQIRRQLVDG